MTAATLRRRRSNRHRVATAWPSGDAFTAGPGTPLLLIAGTGYGGSPGRRT